MLTKLKTPGTDRRLTLMFTLPLLWTENRCSVFIFIREVLAFKELLGAFHEVAAAGLHFVVSLLVSRCRCSWPCAASLEAKPILWFLLWPPWLLSQSEQSKQCLARTCWLQELNTARGVRPGWALPLPPPWAGCLGSRLTTASCTESWELQGTV